MGIGEQILGILFSLAVLFIIWIAIRGIVCWYYKIDQRIENQEQIISLLQSIDSKLSREKTETDTAVTPKQEDKPVAEAKDTKKTINEIYGEKN